MSIKFNASFLPSSTNEYVSWIDVMGTQGEMGRSLKRSANFIFKLHAAAVSAPCEDVKLYPIMDGFYASSPSKANIISFINYVFKEIADEFVCTKEIRHRFLIKGAIAYGPVIHGSDIPGEVNQQLKKHGEYKTSLLLGLPIVHSNLAEKLAPPLGLFVHESARSFYQEGTEPFHTVWWRWFTPGKGNTYYDSIREYFDWCEKRQNVLQYPQEKITAHRKAAEEYFCSE